MGLSKIYRWVSSRQKRESLSETQESTEEPRHYLISLRKLKRAFFRAFTRDVGHNPSHNCIQRNETSSDAPFSNDDWNHGSKLMRIPTPLQDPQDSFSSQLTSLLAQILQSNEERDDSNPSDIPTTPHITAPSASGDKPPHPPYVFHSPFSSPISDANEGNNSSPSHVATSAESEDTTNSDHYHSNDLHLRTPTPPHDLDSSSLQADAEGKKSDLATAPHNLSSLPPNVTTSPDTSHGHDPSDNHATTSADSAALTDNDYDQNNDLHLRTPTPPHDVNFSSPQANAEYHSSDAPAASQISSSLTSNHTTPSQSSTPIPPPPSSTIANTTQPTTNTRNIPIELLQLIFWHCVSDKTAFDFSRRVQRDICLVSRDWMNAALNHPHFWDIATFDFGRVKVCPNINANRESIDDGYFNWETKTRNSGSMAIECIKRMSLHLPTSARNAQLDDLQQFISTFLSRCRHVDIHLPKYRVFSGLNPELLFPAPNSSNDDFLHYATPVFDDITLVKIMEYLQLSQSIQIFSWSSANPLEKSLSSFLCAEDTNDIPPTNVDGNETSDDPPSTPPTIDPATRWPDLSYLRVACRISLGECVSSLNSFTSLVSASLGPIDLSLYTPLTPPPDLESQTLTSLTLTFDTILDAQIALHELFAQRERLRWQSLDSLTIICNNSTYATAFQASRENAGAISSNLALQSVDGMRQLTSLELVNVPFKDGVQLLRRWNSTKLRNLAWRNRVTEFHRATPSQLDIDGNDPDWSLSLPVVQDLQSLSLSFPLCDVDGHSYTSAFLSHIRPLDEELDNNSDSAPDDTLSLEISHIPKALSCLSVLPLVALTIIRPISTADCLNILSSCAKLQHLAVSVSHIEAWSGDLDHGVDCVSLQTLWYPIGALKALK
ncbi:hypothetical protein CVT24_012212 [Panaeolus cyanescens]|uniref:F-box domain-containing protein n=1 Tax=Panaeolus cyanescens TaxID=181874 RepID=A0A409YIQ9_9AGAR|nr:hypothetical protein CVT24_012212 [Panaeolus cyanescens]